MQTGDLRVLGSMNASVWTRIYSNAVSVTATSVTISGLNGDADVEYLIRARIVNGYNGGINVNILPNNDTGGNYGYQYLYGTTSASAVNATGGATGFYLAQNAAIGDLSLGESRIYAKSGFVRTHLNTHSLGVLGTAISGLMVFGETWNNTADNITSLVFLANQTGGLGVGTVIELYKRSDPQ